MIANGFARETANAVSAAPAPAYAGAVLNRPTGWRIPRRALEPWILGLAGFSLTAAAMLAN